MENYDLGDQLKAFLNRDAEVNRRNKLSIYLSIGIVFVLALAERLVRGGGGSDRLRLINRGSGRLACSETMPRYRGGLLIKL
jgi:hypothetical protein